MHQLHFTRGVYHSKYDKAEDIILNIQGEVENYFSETSHWDWFTVIGFVNLTTNKLSLNKKESDYRFLDWKSIKGVNWDEYLGNMMKEKIIKTFKNKPIITDDMWYFLQLGEYVEFLRNLKMLNSKLVTGDINNIKFHKDLLPTKIRDYSGFNEYRFNQIGVTDYNDESLDDDNNDIILGLVDVHF
ncbi:hypothetical protein fh0823_23950 [Francisella halioticida]|uniref:hypothetical protein n=1 Tax=Francisella halioticida TaxID=549298 RepID=UPI001AF98988|nr:hypothetical protein [Francisella halioticida]BCD92256.1 hypothetical protein fh0823_23950 [Francisella halioticida]